MIRIFTTIVLALAPILSTPASAEPGRSQAVRYADLDLTTAAGVSRLHRRVENAVLQVCGDPDRVFPEVAKDIASCRAAVEARMAVEIAARVDHAATRISQR